MDDVTSNEDYYIRTLHWSPKRNLLASFAPSFKDSAAASGYPIRLWDPIQGSLVKTCRYNSIPEDDAWSPDASIAVSSHTDSTIHFWDVQTGDEVHVLTLDGDGSYVPFAIDVHPSGSKLAVGISGGGFLLFDTAEIFLSSIQPPSPSPPIMPSPVQLPAETPSAPEMSFPNPGTSGTETAKSRTVSFLFAFLLFLADVSLL